MEFFAITTIVLFFTTTMMLFLFIITGKKWFHFLKYRYFRKFNYVLVLIFKKSGIVEQKVVKYPEELKLDPKSLIGMAVTRTKHFDNLYNMPVFIAIEGQLATTDLLPIYDKDKSFLNILKGYPDVYKKFLELDKSIKELKIEDNQGEEHRVFDICRSINIGDVFQQEKKEDVFNMLLVRIYHYGVAKGRNMVGGFIQNGTFLYLILGFIALASLAAAYFGYLNNDMLVQTVVPTVKQLAKVTVIGG